MSKFLKYRSLWVEAQVSRCEGVVHYSFLDQLGNENVKEIKDLSLPGGRW
jgi:hypothetical protein